MRLIVFGCSNSAYFHEKTETYRQYKEFKNGEFPPTWSEIMAKELSVDLINYAIPGSGNDSIRMEFVKNVRNIREGDIVIIGWSFIERYMWVNRLKNTWDHHLFGYSSDMDISRNTHQDILINRSHEPSNYLYIEQIYDWMDMINYISDKIGFQVYYWDFDGRILNKYCFNVSGSSLVLNERRLFFKDRVLVHEAHTGTGIFNYVKSLGGEQIIDETNGEIMDHHLGEKGHQVMAKIFLNKLNEGNQLI